jgi:hypothetical protein
MKNHEEALRTELIEYMLEYIEGDKKLHEVLELGTTAAENIHSLPSLSAVVLELHSMEKQVKGGERFSREHISEIFTNMLEILTKDTYSKDITSN